MGDEGYISKDSLKSLIDLNNQINLNIKDTDALLVSLLRAAVAFFCCESASIFIYTIPPKGLSVSFGKNGTSFKNINLEEGNIADWVIQHGQSVVVNDAANDGRFPQFKKSQSIPKNMLAAPVIYMDQCLGVLELFNKNGDQLFSNFDLEMMESFSLQAGISYANSLSYKNLKSIFADEKFTPPNFGVEWKSSILKNIEKTVEAIASTETSVMISGENGTGKSFIAHQLHKKSSRKDNEFVYVNCVGKSFVDLEKELFGESGSIVRADGGTLFLDEISFLPMTIQNKLLSFLQRGFFLSETDKKNPDVRIVASTSRVLDDYVRNGTFSEELYYRLNVLPLNLPPIRKHREDIVPLANYFLQNFNFEHKKNIDGFSADSLKFLNEWDWPGNISEIKNAVERGVINCGGSFISSEDLGLVASCQNFSENPSEVDSSVDETLKNGDRSLKTAINVFKKNYIQKILAEEKWNQTSAARVLDVQRTYVSKLIGELGISRN